MVDIGLSFLRENCWSIDTANIIKFKIYAGDVFYFSQVKIVDVQFTIGNKRKMLFINASLQSCEEILNMCVTAD